MPSSSLREMEPARLLQSRRLFLTRGSRDRNSTGWRSHFPSSRPSPDQEHQDREKRKTCRPWRSFSIDSPSQRSSNRISSVDDQWWQSFLCQVLGQQILETLLLDVLKTSCILGHLYKTEMVKEVQQVEHYRNSTLFNKVFLLDILWPSCISWYSNCLQL